MGLNRMFRRRAKTPTIDRQLAVVTENVEDLATQIFMSVIANNLAMPSRAVVETAMKTFMLEFLATARQQAVADGRPADEVEAYAQIVTSHAQVAFQTKWAELERRRAEQLPHATGMH